ncbi:MAG TPA: hypothetical protein VMT43_07300 [Acidimicrobiales bacterium]|nr:hypothetical protein [Acidimicrobiales bacterium]
MNANDRSSPRVDRHGVTFWVGVAVGWSVIGYGIWGYVIHVGRPVETARWVVGTLLVHDGLIAPLAVVAGLVLAAVLPRGIRGPVTGGLAATAVVLAFSYPLLRAFGRRADNRSILPLDYPRDVVLVCGIIWATVALRLLHDVVRHRTERGKRA